MLTSAVEDFARREPTRLAVVDEGRRIDFAGLDLAVRRMAAWLARQGIRQADTVGMTMRDGYRHLVASLALLRLGCAQITLAGQEPLPMREALARRCKVVCLLGDRAADRIDGVGLLLPDCDAILADPSTDSLAGGPAAGDGASVILTSSGTTGRPKLVACNQRQIFGYGHAATREPVVGYLHYPIETNAGKWINLTNLARGRALVFADAERLSLAEICARYGVTRVNIYPAKLEALVCEIGARGGGRAFEGIDFFTGGTGVTGALRSAVEASITGQLHVIYGATECGMASIAGPGSHAAHPDSVGPAYPGVEIRIVDDAGVELPAGEAGLIRIRSASSATAYMDDDEATARIFRDGWFQPGDIGRMSPDGLLDFIGRGDDMMILNSINIFPAEIELVAQGFPGVRECAAFPMRSAAWGDVPLLAVVGEPGLDPKALLAWCRQRLGTRAPRKIVPVESLPRNAVGKVLRRELASQAARGR